MYNFYLIHGSKDASSLINILKDGYIKSSFYLPHGSNFFGNEDDKYIYFNIFFDDLQNINSSIFNYMLIIHPNIFKDYSFIFDKGSEQDGFIAKLYKN